MESHDMHVIADSNLDTFAEVIRFSRMEFNLYACDNGWGDLISHSTAVNIEKIDTRMGPIDDWKPNIVIETDDLSK